MMIRYFVLIVRAEAAQPRGLVQSFVMSDRYIAVTEFEPSRVSSALPTQLLF